MLNTWALNLIETYDEMYSLEKQDSSNLKVKYYELESVKRFI